MKAYIVGGAVRDELLGLPVKDRDWVVVGATPEEMIAKGFRPVGKDFPVFLHPETHEEYALARIERKSGRGYKGFTVHAAPDVTLEDDLRLGADAHYRRRHRRDGQRQHRRAGAFQLVDEDPLVDRRASEAAVLRRPGNSPPATIAQLENELMRQRALPLVPGLAQLVEELGRQMLANEGTDLVSPGDLLGGEVVAHGGFLA